MKAVAFPLLLFLTIAGHQVHGKGGLFNELTCLTSTKFVKCFNEYPLQDPMPCCQLAYLKHCIQEVAEEECGQVTDAIIYNGLNIADKMAVQPDCGEAGYGSAQCYLWYATSFRPIVGFVIVVALIALVTCCCCCCCCGCCCCRGSKQQVVHPPYVILEQRAPPPSNTYNPYRQ